MRGYVFCILSVLFLPVLVLAGEADVVEVKIIKSEAGTYQFDVTVSHRDEGWEHYSNKWNIVGSDGTVIGTRVLHHPHVQEQPFTRSLSGVKISPKYTTVTVRAHDSVHEYGGRVVTTDVP
jgi:hypothetical protein